MILYGSTPDALAEQQRFYDQYYLGANQQNRAAYDAAYARALEATLRNQENAANLQEQDIARQAVIDEAQRGRDFSTNENQAMRDFTSRENALNRTYTTGEKDANDQDRVFNEAVRVSDWLPTDPAKIQQLYPTLSADRIQRLAMFASQAKTDKDQRNFQDFVTQGARMAAAGDVPTEQTAASFGLSPADPRVNSILKTWRQPYEDQYNQAQEVARQGNLINKIDASQRAIAATPPVDEITKNNFFRRAWNWFDKKTGDQIETGIPTENIVQPNPEALNRIKQRAADLAPYASPTSKLSMVMVDPVTGLLVPNVPRPAWIAAGSRPAATGRVVGDVVRVQSPSGAVGTIPRANLNAALQAGYTLVQ